MGADKDKTEVCINANIYVAYSLSLDLYSHRDPDILITAGCKMEVETGHKNI